MGEVIPFPISTPTDPCQGSLEVWQAADGSWTIDHVSRWGDSAGVVKTCIPAMEEAVTMAARLAAQHSYHFDGLAYTGSRP